MKIPYRYFRSLYTDFFTTTCMIRVPHVLTILVAGIGASQLPLIGTLHVDLAFVASILAGLWGALCEARIQRRFLFKPALSYSRRLIRDGVLLSFFAGVIVTFDLWRGCFSWEGLLFWVFGPYLSLFLGSTIGRFISVKRFAFPTVLALLWMFGIGLGSWLILFFNSPQLYFFNHLWGYWPGPLYDILAPFPTAYIPFRLITLLWGALFLLLSIKEVKGGRNVSRRLGMISVVIALVVGSSTAGYWGGITTHSSLKKSLTTHVQTPHFSLYADDTIPVAEVERWAFRHEFYLQNLLDTLDLEWPEGVKIESYIYANEWQKKELVGAKETSYVPIWLTKDQLHIAHNHLAGVLEHELVHVVAKDFGNLLFNGSWNIALIEGLAEAITQGACQHSTLNELVAAQPEFPPIETIRKLFSPWGFYSESSGLSYTVAGAFVEFLLQEYPVAYLKESYRSSKLSKNYPPLEQLVKEWHQYLSTLKEQTNETDRRRSNALFGQASIWQLACPRNPASDYALLDQWTYYWETDRVEQANEILNTAFNSLSTSESARVRWFSHALRLNKPKMVIQNISLRDTSESATRLIRDAFVMNREWERAKELDSKLDSTSRHRPIQRAMSLKDSLLWLDYVAIEHGDYRPDSSQFNGYDSSLRESTVFRYWNEEFTRFATFSTLAGIEEHQIESSQQRSNRLSGLLSLWLHEKIIGDRSYDLERLAIEDSSHTTDLAWDFSNHLVILDRNIGRLDSASVTTLLEGMAGHPALQSGIGRERYRQRYESTKKWWDFVQTSRFPVVLSKVPVD
jgi:hypothetical protein